MLESAIAVTPPLGWQLNKVWTGILQYAWSPHLQYRPNNNNQYNNVDAYRLLPRVGVPHNHHALWPLVCCCDPAPISTHTHTWDGMAMALEIAGMQKPLQYDTVYHLLAITGSFCPTVYAPEAYIGNSRCDCKWPQNALQHRGPPAGCHPVDWRQEGQDSSQIPILLTEKQICSVVTWQFHRKCDCVHLHRPSRCIQCRGKNTSQPFSLCFPVTINVLLCFFFVCLCLNKIQNQFNPKLACFVLAFHTEGQKKVFYFQNLTLFCHTFITIVV